MIVKIQGGGSGTYANSGSCGGVANYLQHEDLQRMQEGQTVEQFFDQKRDSVKPDAVVNDIDNNRKGLKAQEAKFFVITVAPSRKELQTMGKTKAEQAQAMKDYIRNEVMPKYAEGFGKGLKTDDLKYYAKIHHERHGKDREDLHAHIIVSRKTQDCGKSISPKSNHTGQKNTGAVKGGFNRNAFFESCEKGFDKRFGHDRDIKESFEYRNAVKHGSPQEIKEQTAKVVASEKMNQERGKEQQQGKNQDEKRELTKEYKQEKTRGLSR
jgi:mobB protein